MTKASRHPTRKPSYTALKRLTQCVCQLYLILLMKQYLPLFQITPALSSGFKGPQDPCLAKSLLTFT